MNVYDNIYLTQKANNINLFIYTDVTQQSQIDISVNNIEVNSFALFGFSTTSQLIKDSNINISLQFQVLNGALICTVCDIDIQKCNLVFLASGQQVSGLILEPKESFSVQQSFIQYKISSNNSSGLVNVIKQQSMIFVVNQCKLTGSNLIQSKNNGYIASNIFVIILLYIQELIICVDQTQRLGFESVQISIIGSESVQCDLCDDQIVIYGLCGEAIKYSENVNGMYQCVYPFEYINNQCSCANGYLFNISKCINIIEALNNISSLVNSSTNTQIQILENKVENIENKFIISDLNMLSNITELESRILSNYSKSDNNLMINTTTLDDRIYKNISSIKNDLLIAQLAADSNLLLNTTVLDWRIFNNVSELKNTIQNLTLHLNNVSDILQKQTELIEQQYNTIKNLTQNINCTSNYGYSMINGSCVQVTCAISGQQSINGICQCTNINSVIQAGSCVCPANSNIIGTSCICSIVGQTMQNGQCTCSTTGAFVVNNVCSCGVNSINVSNICSCPSGANLINGVCTCSNINAYISGNQCVCPTYSSLVGNSCTCPINSQIVNNQCVCNQIIDQIMNNGMCECQTTSAFVSNGACTCGLDSLNISNSCQCPVNSSLVNKICTCDKIIGQQMVSGMCQCPSGQQVMNNTCKQTNYVINITNFECSHEIFMQTFDIQSITDQLNSSNNFSSGYVFSTQNIIENAFIDISDNIYTSTVYPLFQSQNTFYNLKIQFGTQSLNGGSFIISSCVFISINQMNIVSKSGSQLILNTAKLNVLTSSLLSANINNLLVNFSFVQSYGNITLISDINGVFNISEYQVLGTYISTQTVAMIGINVNTATINVNFVSFTPSSYNVGNCSSYLFGSAITGSSTFVIYNLAIMVGNSSNYLVLGSIASSSPIQYMFGGIIVYINTASFINVNNIIIDSYQKFSTNYVSYSGFLVGYIQSTSSRIMINNMCLQQNMMSSTLKFSQFGIIGHTLGNTSIQNMSITFSVQGVCFQNFGIVGYQSNYQSEVINLMTSVNIKSDNGFATIGSVFGQDNAKNCSVLNTCILGGNINPGSTQNVGGFIGLQSNANTTIQNSSITNTNISSTYAGADSDVGGIVGECSNSKLFLTNMKIQLVRLIASSSGVVVGRDTNGIYSFVNSLAIQNYINNVKQNECANLSNFRSVSGC
ncbi:Conserved_hypothetical protein [Hexamita inflata]|uniref:Uncharacterized protein n=1 Tax=Hexamita inflata TaxID=28002 RepID=A0AA86RBJ0_9EUKA|nr:Conserved hypothetical protein [Hexamita inflata]